MKKKIINLCFILLTVISCQQNHSTSSPLEKSKANRSELEKVLTFYSRDVKDSLKLKAALFLIENMPGHTSMSGEIIRQHQNEINELLRQDCDHEIIKEKIKKFRFTQNIIQNDVEIITSDFLIKNIENTFSLWESKSWCQQLSFNEFCEYILPYKYIENQVLDAWRDTLSLKFNNTISSIPENDENYNSVYYIGKCINQEINRKIKITSSGERIEKGSSFFNSTLLHQIPFGDCGDYVALILATMRSHGVPAAADYVPQWGNKPSGKHRWITLLNNNGKHLPIPHLDQNPGDVFFPTYTIPKVYRQTYAINPERNKYVEKSSYIFTPLTQFQKDVTSCYTSTANIAIPIKTKDLIDNYAYISCSSYHDWNMVDFGLIKNGIAYFNQMGTNIVYLIWGYDGSELIPVSEPFILNQEGHIHYLKADSDSSRSITLRRKYPKAYNTANVESRMIGSKIQATNDNKLKKWSTFYEITDDKYPDKIPIQTDSTFRYWRLLGGESSYMNIAELHFFNTESDSLLSGKIIGSGVVFKNDPTYDYSKAFDGDWLTYFLSADPRKEAWIGLDLSSPIAVKYARCIPRSDDNSIRYSEVYELVYWKEGEWKVIDRQIAKENFLTFDSVPGNSLLLLKNLTRGKEERIFTYKDGKQIWW